MWRDGRKFSSNDVGAVEESGVPMGQSQENETHRLRVNYAQISPPPHLCAKGNVLAVE